MRVDGARTWAGRKHPLWLILGVLLAATPVCLTQAPVGASADAKPQPQKPESAESARKKHISNQSSQLLAMALALKAEMDKTDKDTLSMKVIRKADEIERLAKTVRENGK